jgi:hypothetical protein
MNCPADRSKGLGATVIEDTDRREASNGHVIGDIKVYESVAADGAASIADTVAQISAD